MGDEEGEEEVRANSCPGRGLYAGHRGRRLVKDFKQEHRAKKKTKGGEKKPRHRTSLRDLKRRGKRPL